MTHVGGGSGASPELNALLAVNSIRYVRKYHSAAYASAFQAAVVLSEALRCWKADRKGVLWTVLNEHLWTDLPGPTTEAPVDDFPHGAVIIPAHNESQVIGRTLEPLAPLAAAGVIDVFVVCNGCVDDTAEIARGFDGVTVLEMGQASKSAALNAGDAAATVWPRLYLDADIQITPAAVRDVMLQPWLPGSFGGAPGCPIRPGRSPSTHSCLLRDAPAAAIGTQRPLVGGRLWPLRAGP